MDGARGNVAALAGAVGARFAADSGRMGNPEVGAGVLPNAAVLTDVFAKHCLPIHRITLTRKPPNCLGIGPSNMVDFSAGKRLEG